MRVNLVAAVAANGVIGRDGELPWRIPADLRRFREITMGHPLIMGRRTRESIGRPLPGRLNIVLSRSPDCRAEGSVVVADAGAALAAAGNADEVMVIGGGEIYALFLPRAERIFLTRVDAVVDGDAHFPPLDSREWISVDSEHHPATDKAEFAYSFEILERTGPPPLPPDSNP